MDFEVKDAMRHEVPLLLSVSGASGSGKTMSALLLAAGLAGPDGQVVLIDTENGRGSLYCDSPTVLKAFPRSFKVIDFPPPFEPVRYIRAMEVAEAYGRLSAREVVCVIDSASHEWEGTGGCCEIAEKNKLRGMPNWSMAKLAHKRFVNHCLSTSMHLVFCLRARDKVKIFNAGDKMILSTAAPGDGEPPVAEKSCVVPIGLQPIAEKSFVFEMLVSVLLDEKSHHALPLKVPEPLLSLFPGGRLLTPEDGARIREWNKGGKPADAADNLRKRMRTAAEDGALAFEQFKAAMTNEQKRLIGKELHDELAAIAANADQPPPREPGEDEGDEPMHVVDRKRGFGV
jgi:hypothetical protein